MHRRTLLSALAAGLAASAGCTSTEPGPAAGTDGPETTLGTSPATDAPTETDGNDRFELGDASIVDLETAPVTLALAPTTYRTHDGAQVGIEFARTATADHPAVVRARLENANDFPNTFRLRETPPFGKGGTVSDQPREPGEEWGQHEAGYRVNLLLAPTENHDLAETVPDYELAADGTWRLASKKAGSWLPDRVRLEPGEVVEGEYVLLGRPEGVEYGRPTSTYDFSWRDGGISITAWETDAPGPDGGSRFAGTDVPAVREDGAVAWYHDADPSTASYVLPETEHTDLPASVDFTFVNHDREGTSCGHWSLYKLIDGEWFHVGPWVQTADCRFVRPGGTKNWTLKTFAGESVPCRDGVALSVGHLGGGLYGAVAGYGHATPESGALVEIEADPVEIVPTDDVTGERDGSTVVVTDSKHGDGEHPPDATLTVTRTDAEADSRLIPEQVMRRRLRGLRNALAFFEEGVETVVVRTDEHVAENVVGYETDVGRFAVAGTTYDVRIERFTTGA
jgi:hypothetical protein